MARGTRLFAALTVALLCAPGTFLRSSPPTAPQGDIAAELVQGAGPTPAPGWEVAGVWRYRDGSTMFGGFSALLALDGHRLRAFSDRGTRFTFAEPDQAAGPQDLARQWLAPTEAFDLRDIEAATQDPVTRRYWLAYEGHHSINRFASSHAPDGKRDLEGEVDWRVNSGAEAMVRLGDGRFVVLPEREDHGLIYASDPVAGSQPKRFVFRNPAPGFAATDMIELPDKRLLLLLRGVAWARPNFTTRLAIGPAPKAGGVFAPTVIMPLEPTVPRENYEGLAMRPRSATWTR